MTGSAKQSKLFVLRPSGSLRRFAPRDDGQMTGSPTVQIDATGKGIDV